VLLSAFQPPHTRSCHLLGPSIERLVHAVAGMERADVQQQAALATAAPPTVERHREQQRSQAPSYINPRDPRLHLSDPQPRTLSPEPLPPGSAAADASDSGSPVSAESEQGQAESSDRQASPTQPAGSEGQQGAEERSQRRCSISGHQWRRHPTTGAWLCSACRKYAERNSGSLPSTAVLQRREQQRQVVAASKLRHVPSDQRQCLECGASTPGAGCHWHRHPATKEEWMCNRCYQRALHQPKQRREHEAASAASSNDGDVEAWEEGEEAQPPSQAPAATQQQAASVQPLMPGPPVQQGSSAIAIASYVADTRQQQQLRALSQQQQQQPQAVTPDATWRLHLSRQPCCLPTCHQPKGQQDCWCWRRRSRRQLRQQG
jgi:hypothetical protein